MATTNGDRSSPLRTCVGCRRRAPQTELVRCALDGDRPVVSRTAPGRGAWLCGPACLPAAIARRAFDRAWRRPAPPDVEEALRTGLGSSFGTPHPDMEDLKTRVKG